MRHDLSSLASYCLRCLFMPLLLVGIARAEYPERPIQIVVPFGPGGGTDTYARALKQVIEENDLLPQPLVIVNVPGAGATIGSRRVKNAEPDGYTLLLLHEAIVTAKYSGQADYGPEAFEPIAGTGQQGMVIAVREDSPHRSLQDLLDAAKRTAAKAAEPAVIAMTNQKGSPKMA